MVALEIEESTIDDHYIVSKFASFTVVIDKSNGFFNATKLCNESGKRLNDYIRTKEFDRLCDGIAQIYGSTLLLQASGIPTKNMEAGTYFHPLLFLALASWCSHDFYINSCIIVNDFFTRTAERRKMFASNFKVNEKDTYLSIEKGEIGKSEELSEKEILYGGFNLSMNNRGFFNATKLCSQKGMKLYKFTRLESFTEFCDYVKDKFNINVVDSLSSNLSKRFDSAQGTYFHPILFLKLAAWLSTEFYITIAQLVVLTLNQCDDELKLFAIHESEQNKNETTESLFLDQFTEQARENLESPERTILETGITKKGESVREIAGVAEKKRKRSDESTSSENSSAQDDELLYSPSNSSGNRVQALEGKCKYLRVQYKNARKNFGERITDLEETLSLKDDRIVELEDFCEKKITELEEFKEKTATELKEQTEICNNLKEQLKEKEKEIEEKYLLIFSRIKKQLIETIAPNSAPPPEKTQKREFLEVHPIRNYINVIYLLLASTFPGKARVRDFFKISNELNNFTCLTNESMPRYLFGVVRKPGNRLSVIRDIIEKFRARSAKNVTDSTTNDEDSSTSELEIFNGPIIPNFNEPNNPDDSRPNNTDQRMPNLSLDNNSRKDMTTLYVTDDISNYYSNLFPIAEISTSHESGHSNDIKKLVKNFTIILKVLKEAPFMILSYTSEQLKIEGNNTYIIIFSFYITRSQAVNYRVLMTNFIRKLPKAFDEIPPLIALECDKSSPWRYLNVDIQSANSVNLYNTIKQKICRKCTKNRRVTSTMRNYRNKNAKMDFNSVCSSVKDNTNSSVTLIDEDNREYEYICNGNIMSICLIVSTYHDKLSSDEANTDKDITLTNILELRKVRMRLKNIEKIVETSTIDKDQEFWSTFQDPNILTMRLLNVISQQENVALRLARSIDETLL